jgi:hypothetical protein
LQICNGNEIRSKRNAGVKKNLKTKSMNLFKKEEPQTIEVKGHQLICPICSNNLFLKKTTLGNLGGFFNDWSTAVVCSECTYVFWFGSEI